MTIPPDLAADLARLPDDEWAARFLDGARAASGAAGAALLGAGGERVAESGALPEREPEASEIVAMAPASGALWLLGVAAAEHAGLAALGGLRWALAEGREEEGRQRVAREAFFSMVGHDLKGPLSGIKAIADLIGWRMARGKLDPATAEGRAELERRLATLVHRVTEMAALIKEIGELGRIERGQLVIEPTAGDLASIARAAVERFRGYDASDLTIEESGEPLPVRADGRRIAALLEALLRNAARHNDPGVEITLRLRREGDLALAEVRDDGEGVAPKLQPRLFHEYGRAVQASASGLGIGLYVAHAIARAHGGTLGLDSEPAGGTVVTLALPIA